MKLIHTQTGCCGQGLDTIHCLCRKRVVYGSNADVKGIVVMIYRGPAAELWCIALWWIRLRVGPDKFWTHLRACCTPGAQPRRMTRGSQIIININKGAFVKKKRKKLILLPWAFTDKTGGTCFTEKSSAWRHEHVMKKRPHNGFLMVSVTVWQLMAI